MAECIKCRSFNLCPWATPPEIICSQFNPTTQTNADHIRSMTDEELARFIAGQLGWYCDFKDPEEEEYPKVLDWLKAPVEVDNEPNSNATV